LLASLVDAAASAIPSGARGERAFAGYYC